MARRDWPFRKIVVLAALAPSRPVTVSDDTQRIVGFLRSGMNAPEFQPPVLPAAAIEMFELSRDPEVSLTRIRELMEREPVIAAKVMSTAQSAFYARGNPIESLDEALVRLGVKRLTGIFLEASMRMTVIGSKMFEKPLEALRKHGVATGHIARGVCSGLKLPADRAFLCGLLHDVGIAGCYALLSKIPKSERPKRFEVAADAVRIVHEEASRIMAAKWNLPYGIRWVVGNHHTLEVSGHVNPMTAVVILSDWLASESGADGLGEADPDLAKRAATHFGLGENDVKRLLDRSKQVVSQLP